MPKLTYCGHSCVLVESSRGNVIIDPFLTGNPKASHKPEDIPELSAVLITHGHADHLGDGVALARRDGAPVVATFELATLCQQQGAEAVPMNIGGVAEFAWGKVRLVQALHSSSVQVGDSFVYAGMPTGMLYTAEGKTLYHLGDTDIFSDMALIGRRNAPIDVALIPIGDHFTAGVVDAVEACKMIQPKVAIPIHFGTFPPIERDPQEFARQVADLGGKAVVLNPGESYEY